MKVFELGKSLVIEEETEKTSVMLQINTFTGSTVCWSNKIYSIYSILKIMENMTNKANINSKSR